MLVHPGGVQPNILQEPCQIGIGWLLLKHTALYTMDSVRCAAHGEGLPRYLEGILAESSKIDNSWQPKLTRGAKPKSGATIQELIPEYEGGVLRRSASRLELWIQFSGRIVTTARRPALRERAGTPARQDPPLRRWLCPPVARAWSGGWR